MIALLLAVVVVQADAPPPVQVREAETTTTFAFPSELAPAMVPYIDCLSKGLNTAIKDAGQISLTELPKIAERVKQGCAAAREQAKAQGIRLLNASDKGSSSQHEVKVEETLASAEKSVLEPPAPPPFANSP